MVHTQLLPKLLRWYIPSRCDFMGILHIYSTITPPENFFELWYKKVSKKIISLLST